MKTTKEKLEELDQAIQEKEQLFQKYNAEINNLREQLVYFAGQRQVLAEIAEGECTEVETEESLN